MVGWTPDLLDEGSPRIDVSLDRAFHLLSNSRRRLVLEILDGNGQMELGDVAERVAADENDTDVAALSMESKKRVYVQIYQTHAPKLDEVGLVKFDQSAGVLMATSDGKLLAEFLRLTEDAFEES